MNPLDQTARKLTVGSLFSGIGGLELGLEQTGGFETIWQCEIDPYARAVLKRHWPEVPCHDDITTLDPERFERPDVICGGSPCQDLSTAGKRAGLGGQRSGLFYEYMRVVGAFRPRWILWENVAGALSSNGGADFFAVLGEFRCLGYDAEWCCLHASDFGYPHRRRRVFLVAYPRGERPQGFGADGTAPGTTRRGDRAEMADAECRRRDRGPSDSGREAQQRETLAGSGTSPIPPPGPGELDRWADILIEAPWLTPAIEPGVCGVADGFSEVLDGRPVDVERRHRLKALGNAVVPACARWIGERILETEQLTA